MCAAHISTLQTSFCLRLRRTRAANILSPSFALAPSLSERWLIPHLGFGWNHFCGVCLCVFVCDVMVHSTVQHLSRGDTPTRVETFLGLHTPANYCSLINQHILINQTHTYNPRAYAYVWLCACSVAQSGSMDLSGQRTHVNCQKKHTHAEAHTLPFSPGPASHQRNVCRGNFVCWQNSTKSPGSHTSRLSYTHRVSAFIAKSWASHYKARLAREAGLLGGHKAPSVTQTVAVSGY